MSKSVLTVEEQRKQRAKELGRRLALFVGVPTFVAAFYYIFLATTFYESESQFYIYSAADKPSIGDSILGSLGATSSSRDAMAATAFIESRDALEKLNAPKDFLKHYQFWSLDFFSSLSSFSTQESAYDFYKNKIIDTSFDSSSNIVTLKLRARTSEKAHLFNKRLLEAVENVVNGISKRSKEDKLKFAQSELKLAEKRLKDSQITLSELQKTSKDFDAIKSVMKGLSIQGELESKLVQAQTELNELRSYMQESAPQVIALKNKIDSIKQKIRDEKMRLITPKGQKKNTQLMSFELQLLEKEFAQKAYEAALKFLEKARLDVIEQQRYLAIIVPPSKPDEAAYPKRISGILSVLVGVFAAYFVISMLIMAIREHARI